MNTADAINIIKSNKDYNLLHSNGSHIPIKICTVVDDCQVVYKFWNRDDRRWSYGIQPISFFVALFVDNRLKTT